MKAGRRIPLFVFFIILVTSGLGFISHYYEAADYHDVIIRNGQIIDGTGRKGYFADVAIRGNEIVAIGNLARHNAHEILDARGKTITPGFIDVHSHADGARGEFNGIRSSDPMMKAAHNLVRQGITTVVVNQDGRSPVSIATQRNQLTSRGVGPNVVLMVGHNSIRRQAMGEDYKRNATEQEIAEMKALLHNGLEAGAFGMTAGLEYVPGRWSTTDELIELVGELNAYGGVYIVHERSSGSNPMWFHPSRRVANPGTMLDNILEVIAIAETTGVPSCATHIKVKGMDYWGNSDTIIQVIQQARDRGVPIWADQYPYNTTGSDGNTILIPDWVNNRIKDTMGQNRAISYSDRLEKLLHDPAIKANFTLDVDREIERRGGAENIIIFDYPDRRYIGQSLAAMVIDWNLEITDVVLKLQKEGYQHLRGGVRMRGFSLNEEDIRAFTRQPWVMTASDAGIAHPDERPVHARFYGTFPRKVGRFAQREGLISVEEAVHSACALPAQFLGLSDRGTIEVGYKSDLLVLDLNDLMDEATFFDPHQYPEGVEQVMINGEWIVRDDRLTNRLPGEVLVNRKSYRYAADD